MRFYTGSLENTHICFSTISLPGIQHWCENLAENGKIVYNYCINKVKLELPGEEMQMMRTVNSKKNKNLGFTLVELIVVLVILAILAAILVPTLLSWIDRARKQEELLHAKTCLTLVQAGVSELYAVNGDKLQIGNLPENTIIGASNVKLSNNKGVYMDVGTVNATERPFAVTILNQLDLKKGDKANEDSDPYCIMFGVGSNMPASGKGDYGTTTTKHEKYTVYYMLYMETEKSAPLFYYDGNWSTVNPYKAGIIDKNNLCASGPLAGKNVQFYVISNKTTQYPSGDSKYWAWYKEIGDE